MERKIGRSLGVRLRGEAERLRRFPTISADSRRTIESLADHLVAFSRALDHVDAGGDPTNIEHRRAPALATAGLTADEGGALLNATRRLGALVGAVTKARWYRPGTPAARALVKPSTAFIVDVHKSVEVPLSRALPSLRKDPGVTEAAFREVDGWLRDESV